MQTKHDARVSLDAVGAYEVLVSTVRRESDGRFETRVFGGPDHDYVQEFETKGEAEIGHAEETAIQRARFRARNKG